MFAMSKEGGMLVCPIDICLTPTPVGDIPIPYPNMGEAPMAEPGAETVLICGCPALNTASEIAMTEGDEPGASGGIMSGEIMGAGKFMEGSQKVRIEGVANHINKFWEPRMRRELFEHIDKGGEGLLPLVLEASKVIKRPVAA